MQIKCQHVGGKEVHAEQLEVLGYWRDVPAAATRQLTKMK
jgi:hypothetical protein